MFLIFSLFVIKTYHRFLSHKRYYIALAPILQVAFENYVFLYVFSVFQIFVLYILHYPSNAPDKHKMHGIENVKSVFIFSGTRLTVVKGKNRHRHKAPHLNI